MWNRIKQGYHLDKNGPPGPLYLYTDNVEADTNIMMGPNGIFFSDVERGSGGSVSPHPQLRFASFSKPTPCGAKAHVHQISVEYIVS